MPDNRRNASTFYVPGREGPDPSFYASFERVYEEMERIHRGFPRDGVLIAAVWNGDLVDGYLHVPVSERPEFAVVGRHDNADLVLGRDESMSLRHVGVAVSKRGLDEVRIRLIDFQTGRGMRAEDGTHCEALIADGPLFVSVGRYQLFLLPTGTLANPPWSRTARDTWDGLPERVYLDRRIPARRHAPALPVVPDRSRKSIITHIVPPPQPLRRRPPVGDRGDRIAALALESRQGAAEFAVHQEDVRRGLLIGRYERCDLGVDDHTLSRVHLLIVEHDGDVWAVDAASLNGSSFEHQDVRQVSLGRDAVMFLGSGTRLTWTRAN